MTSFDMDSGFVLLPIEEDAEDDANEETCQDLLETSKLRTEALATAAEKDFEELAGLLGKLKTSTVSREEKSRLKSLHAKLDGMKADLKEWKELESKAEMRMLRSVASSKVIDIVTEMRKKDIRSVMRQVGAAESVDLAFIIDCTGSMASYIDSVKSSITEIVRRIRRTNGNLNLRLAVVGYRDIRDEKRFEVLDFVDSVDVFQSFVGELVATGGGDAPEDVAGALQKANGLAWSQTSRAVFLIADAPCHGTLFHSHSMDDDFPTGTPGIDVIKELKELLAKQEVRGSMSFNFGRITNHTDHMVSEFRREGAELDVVGLEDVKKVTACVTKTVRKTIFKTMKTSGEGKSVAFASAPDVGSLLKGGVFSVLASTTSVSLKRYSVLPTVSNDWKTCQLLLSKCIETARLNLLPISRPRSILAS